MSSTTRIGILIACGILTGMLAMTTGCGKNSADTDGQGITLLNVSYDTDQGTLP